uniref:Uncharacterized protein n=1 Tax=Chenopodium quinoa TaxID=63459 RepID=A0A803MR78_CHEQI
MAIKGRRKKQVTKYQVESSDELSSKYSSSGSMSESDFEYEPKPDFDPIMQYSVVCSDDVSECYSSGDEVRKAQRKARRKRKIDPKVFVDNSKTLGGKVKEDGIVIASFKSKKKQEKVPKKVVNQDLEDRLWNTYNTKTTCGTRGITRKTLVQYLEGPCVDEDEFKKVFLMYVLSVLCSSTCHRMKKQFLHSVSVADNAPLYNWCKFVLDELMKALGQFSIRFYGDDLNFNASCGGCTLFLAINDADTAGDLQKSINLVGNVVKEFNSNSLDKDFYQVQSEEILSNSDVDVNSLVWNVTHFVGALFNGDAFAPNQSYILIENPMQLNMPGNQYMGPKYTLGNDCSNFCETNVFNGMFSSNSLDSSPICVQEQRVGQLKGEHKEKEINEERLSTEKEIWQQTLEKDKNDTGIVLDKEKEKETENEKEKEKVDQKEKENEDQKENEKEDYKEKKYQKEKEKKEDKENEKLYEKENVVNENVKEKENEKEKKNEEENDNVNDKETDKENVKEKDHDKEKDQSGKAQLLEGQEKTLENVNGPEISDDVDGHEITFESEDEPETKEDDWGSNTANVLCYTLKAKYIRRFRDSLLQYVMDNSSGRLRSLDSESTMLCIDGHMVKLNLCGMLASCVGEVCDQTMVLNAKGLTQKIQRTIKAYCKHMMQTPTNRVNVVFVPICRDGHWWCVAFSMNMEEVIVIDSLETKNACDTRSLEVDDMLLERSWILCEDLLSDFNESRDAVFDIIKPLVL